MPVDVSSGILGNLSDLKSVVILSYNGGSEVIVSPEIWSHRFTKDFGVGFYVTNLSSQSNRWSKRNTPSIVNVYSVFSYKDLNFIKFEKMTEEWLDFVVGCRSGKCHDYDIVEGPIADDTIHEKHRCFYTR